MRNALRMNPLTPIATMDTEETKEVVPAPAPAPAPTADAAERLNAAREFASEQYEKVVRAAAEQMEQVGKYTEEARKQVGKYTEEARKQLNESWDATCDKAQELRKAGEAYVKENPTGSVLGALGVGLILGLLLGAGKR